MEAGVGPRILSLLGSSPELFRFPMSVVFWSRRAKMSQRERELQAHVVVYYVIAMALFMNASCREVLRCLWKASIGRATVLGR